MTDQQTALTSLVPTETIQTLQRGFSRLGQVTVCSCDVNGAMIVAPTWGSHYSELIGTSPRGHAELQRSLRRACQNTTTDEPIECHAGITLYAAPVIHAGQTLAVVVAGTRRAVSQRVETVRAVARDYDIEPEVLVRARRPDYKWTGGTPESIREFTDLAAHTLATMYGQAKKIGRQLADLRVVHGLAEHIAGTVDLEEILDATVCQVADAMNVKACGIRLLDEETGELVIKAVCNLSDEYLGKGAVLLHENAIDAAAFSGQAVYIEDARTDPRIRYPDNARREGIVSGLCVPLTFRGQTLGVLRIYTSAKRRFSDGEVRLLRSIGSQSAAAIITTRLFAEHVKADRIQRQVAAAGQIQRRMLPQTPRPRDGVEFGAIYQSSLEVGGDFYDFIERPDGSVTACIGDVVGKGMPAAMLMASIRSALRVHLTTTTKLSQVDLAEVVAHVNRHMYRDTLISEFATLFVATLNAGATELTYVCAGHPPGLLLRGDDCVELDSGGLVIGINADEAFGVKTVDFQSGDALVLVTDGVTEAMDFQGRLYGTERFRQSIMKHRSLSAVRLSRQVLWDVRRFVGLAEQSDDTTILAITKT